MPAVQLLSMATSSWVLVVCVIASGVEEVARLREATFLRNIGLPSHSWLAPSVIGAIVGECMLTGLARVSLR
jgi:hypothetical protein